MVLQGTDKNIKILVNHSFLSHRQWSEFVRKVIDKFDVRRYFMTSNQIAYATLEEARRHNQAYEAETAIHNRNTESIGWQQASASVKSAEAAMYGAHASMYGAQASMQHAAAAMRSANASIIGANAQMYNVVGSLGLRERELEESIRHSTVSESTEQARTKAYGVSVLGSTFKNFTSGLYDVAGMYNKIRRGY